ncbi:Peptidoglycan/LPS O-acetylase OafA/YrhL, contains acyltransferase and SGNH-hydrolase domains [Streptomyces sp. yr375]|nr:Peptidoglycan/LPS O-acetylase OafA/YrhL, contains acyltransferase and SGNH-hydrolase domains [Streptomyces sp. yr375]
MTGLALTRAAQPKPVVRGHRPERSGRRPGRLYAVDGIRLLAALMVALHHYAGTRRVDRPGNPVWGRPVSDVMPTVFHVAAYGWIGVEIFFVISGFVICMSCWGRTPRQFFVSRVIRLYPAYWFAVLFTTGVLAALPGVWERLRLRDVFVNLTMLQSGSGVRNVDGVYWTLWSELRFYLLFLVVVRMGLTYRRVVVFCCVWGAAAMPAPVAGFPLLELLAAPESAWYFIAGLALYLMHRFGQDLLLWGILGMAWLMAQKELGDRIDEVEHVSGWRGAVLIFTVFLLVMVAVALGHTDRSPRAVAGDGGRHDVPPLPDALRGGYDGHQPPARGAGRTGAGGGGAGRVPGAELGGAPVRGAAGGGRGQAGAGAGVRGELDRPRGFRQVSAAFELRHSRGIVSGSIGGGGGPYGRLAGLLGRVLMLRASRREDRKRVPQYSSS